MPSLFRSCSLVLLCVVPGLLAAQNTVGEVFASDAAVRGAVVLVGGGTQVLSGSQVAAGASSALLRLTRGGDVRICPGTELSVATSPKGDSLMLSLSLGSIETNYRVNAVVDSILTPDFKMQMIGPGVFHLAIAANVKGDTCVRPLESNTASVIVTEMMGIGTYQVKPGEEVVFRGGKITGAANSAMEGCGCPVPPPVQRAEIRPEEKPAPVATTQHATQNAAVQLDAPFVFRGNDPQAPDAAYGIASLKTRDASSVAVTLQPTVIPPKDEPTPQELKKQREADKQEEQKRAKDTAQLAKATREEQQKRDQEEARISAAQKSVQAKRDKESARQSVAAQKEQVRRDKEISRSADAAKKEQARQDSVRAHATEKTNREQAEKDKEALRQAALARTTLLKQEQAAAKKQGVLSRKQQAREQKIAKAQEQKQQQARALELDSARREQAKQEVETKRQAELSRQRELQAAQAGQKRAQEIAKAQSAAKTKAEQKTEPNVLKKIGSFFGKLFKG